MFLVIIQVTLGALTVISRRDPLVNSLHVVVGALVLTTSLLLTLRSWRVRFAAQRREPQSSQSTQSDKHIVSAASARSAVKRGEVRA
jgi:heme A synthase